MPGFPVGGVGTHYADRGLSIAEDVTDVLYQITPQDTPIMNSIGEGSAGDVLHFWQKRSIGTYTLNVAPEGFTYNFTQGLTLTTRESNWTQVMQKEIRVSNTQQAIRHYAINDFGKDQVQIRLAEIAKEFEYTLVNATMVTGGIATMRQMQGFRYAIASGASGFVNFGAASLTETLFNNELQNCWDLGGEPRDVFVGGTLKRRISGFTAGSTKFIPADQQRAVNTISIYESDFFPINIHLSRVVYAGSATTSLDLLMLDRSMCKKIYLRRFTSKEIPETADSEDYVIVGEPSLEWGDPTAHRYLQNCT